MPRRFRRYGKRRMVIGTGEKNSVSMCANTETVINLDWSNGNFYPDSPLFLSPFYENMINRDNQSMLSDLIGVVGAFKSYDFRKFITMYQEVKIKGVYIKITPLELPTDIPYVTFYHMWDRKARSGSWTAAGNTWASQTTSRMIKSTCQSQSTKLDTFASDKGRMYLRTKCAASGIIEKATWIDSQVTYRKITSGGRYYNRFFVSQPFTTDGLNGYRVSFNPGCSITAELSTKATGAIHIPVKIEMRTYVSFRNPGMSTLETTVQLLLKTNGELIPGDDSAKSIVKGATAEDDPDGPAAGETEEEKEEEEEEDDEEFEEILKSLSPEKKKKLVEVFSEDTML